MRTLVAGTLSAACLAVAGCQAVEQPVKLPIAYQASAEQLLLLSDLKLDNDHPLVRELSTLREQVADVLELPLKRDPIVVYLFKNEAEYRRYMNEKFGLKSRSAYFLETSSELAVYAHWGEKVRDDLRHEYTHGLLHSAAKNVPLWLDEGLAEYFEVVGPRPGGVNTNYVRRLSDSLAKGWRPDLKRLENLDDHALMKAADYQESWAWVHFLLGSTPENKRVLVGYLKDLRSKTDPKPISRRLRSVTPDFEDRFASYLSQLRTPSQVADKL